MHILQLGDQGVTSRSDWERKCVSLMRQILLRNVEEHFNPQRDDMDTFTAISVAEIGL
jgi:hypothetical protein